MEAQVEMLHLLTQPKKDNNQFKCKEQPELPENHLHRSPTTKELKEHSSKLVIGAEMGSWGGEDIHRQGEQITWEEQQGTNINSKPRV